MNPMLEKMIEEEVSQVRKELWSWLADRVLGRGEDLLGPVPDLFMVRPNGELLGPHVPFQTVHCSHEAALGAAREAIGAYYRRQMGDTVDSKIRKAALDRLRKKALQDLVVEDKPRKIIRRNKSAKENP